MQKCLLTSKVSVNLYASWLSQHCNLVLIRSFFHVPTAPQLSPNSPPPSLRPFGTGLHCSLVLNLFEAPNSFRANLALQVSAKVPANLQSFYKLIRFLAQLALQPSAKYEPKLF